MNLFPFPISVPQLFFEYRKLRRCAVDPSPRNPTHGSGQPHVGEGVVLG